MLWLQSNERYDTFAQFDPASGVLKEFTQKLLGRKPPKKAARQPAPKRKAAAKRVKARTK